MGLHHEYAGGAVLFSRNGHEIDYVLVEETDGHCGFPKGHIEGRESEKEAVLREIREETGIEAALIDGFREEAVYPKGEGVIKHITYFLACFAGQKVCGQAGEIADIFLLPFAQAHEKVTYQSSKSILEKAHAFILQKEQMDKG